MNKTNLITMLFLILISFVLLISCQVLSFSDPNSVPTNAPTTTPVLADPTLTKINETLLTSSGLTVSAYGGYLNGESFQEEGIISYNGYQYAAFWNTSRHVCLSRRLLSGNTWSIIEFADYTNSENDDHNTISIGICPNDETIHLAFDHHSSNLHYRVSATGLAGSSSGWDTSSFGAVTSILEGSTTITQVTYPRFITTPQGNLLFEYRYGTSGSGDQYLYEYNGTTHVWASIGKYIDGITNSNNAYAHGIAYDKYERLHETWCWRDTPDASTNHDFMYIYSDDNGRNWKNNAGTLVATTGSTYISSSITSTRVYTISQNRGLINQEAQALDSSGQVHVLLSHMPDSQTADSDFTSARTKAVYFHYWRKSDGTWSRTQLGSGYLVVKNFRGKILFDSNDNLYAVLPDLSIATASAASNWSNWTLADTQDQGRFYSDPLIDAVQLKTENRLTVFYPRKNGEIYILSYNLDGGNIPETLYFNNFNSLSTNAPPAGWIDSDAVNCTSTIENFPGAGDKSLKLYDDNASGAACIEYNFTSQADIIKVEWKWNTAIVGNWGRIILSDSSPNTSGDSVTAINIYLAGSMIWRDSSGLDHSFMNYSANTWYSMKLIINIPVNTYDIYVNNALTVSNVGFRYPMNSLSWLSFKCGLVGSTSTYCYYDDVKITVY